MEQRQFKLDRRVVSLAIVVFFVASWVVIARHDALPARPGTFDTGNLDGSDATNVPLYFAGMHYNWTATLSWYAGTFWGMEAVTDAGGGLFNITSPMFGNRTVNGTTRAITAATSYTIGSHDWTVIFNNVSVGNTVAITPYGPTGDQTFTVQETVEVTAGGRLFTCWRLTSPQGSILYYDHYSGILVNGTFVFTYMASTYTYTVQLTGTNKPLTPNTLAPVLTGDGVNPVSGTQATPFNFSITYTDADGNGPGSITVAINGSHYPLAKVQATDLDYMDGCLYSGVVYLQTGSYQYYFAASDGLFPVTSPVRTNLTVGYSNLNAPVLSGANVNPKTGIGGSTNFTFRVTYTDNDNNVPLSVNVTIEGIVHAMQKQDPLDTNFIDGCTYTFTTLLHVYKNVTYHFVASDGTTSNTLGPFTDVDVQYLFPLFNDGMTYNYNYVHSSYGTFAITTGYTFLPSGLFQLSSTGPFTQDRTVNGTSRLVVEGDTISPTGSHDWVRIHPFVDVGDKLMITNMQMGDWEFTVTGTTSCMGPLGTFQCWVLSNNIVGSMLYYDRNTGLLIQGNFGFGGMYTVTIIPTGTNLDLSPNSNKPTLTSPAFTPASGTETTTFNVTVVYSDADNNAPKHVDALIGGQRFPLEKQDPGDSTYTDGCVYRMLACLPAGTLDMAFETFDGKFLVQSDPMPGPEVTRVNGAPPSLSNGGVTPSNGYNGTTIFSFSVTYTDPDNNYPSYMNVVIGSTVVGMQRKVASDTNLTDGCVYEYNTTLDVGSYVFSFEASDGDNVTSLGPFSGLFVTLGYDWGNSRLDGVRIACDTLHGQNPRTYYAPGTSWDTPINTDLAARGATLVDIVEPYTVGLLSNYDVLWLGEYNIDWTTDELDAVVQWVHDGGSLLITGDAPQSSLAQRFNISYPSMPLLSQSSNDITDHPVTEWIDQVYFSFTTNGINITLQPAATSCIRLAGYDMVVAMHHGLGRVVIAGSEGFVGHARDVTENRRAMNNTFGWLGHHANFGFPVLSSGGVLPAAGNESTLFTFSVTYTDLDNNRPFEIDVVIDGVHHAMAKQDDLDGNYTDGCAYGYQAYLPAGTHEYFFYCQDEIFTNATTNATVLVTSENANAPQITDVAFSPDGGVNNTVFNFTCIYVDADNNLPENVTVSINGSVHVMLKADPSDINALDGIVYYHATCLGWGHYQFAIEASDGVFLASTGWLDGPDVLPFYAIENQTLFHDDFEGDLSKWSTVTGQWHVSTLQANSPTHSAWFGEVSSNFYSDNQNGDLITVSIDLSTAPQAYLEFYHRLVSEPGYDYASVYLSKDGGAWTRIYNFAGTISSWTRFTYNMSSYCGSSDVKVRFNFLSDYSGTYQGWFVDDVKVYTNSSVIPRPVLLLPANTTTTWHGNTTFSWTGVSMSWGEPSYRWQFSEDPLFASTVYDASGIAGAGPTVAFSSILDVATGEYYWRVRAEESGFASIWSETFTLNVIRNEMAPALTAGQVSPASGDQLDTYTFTVVYGDADNNTPSYVRVTINGSIFSMAKQDPLDENYVDGCTYVHACSLVPGSYQHSFSTSDGLYANTTGPHAGPSVIESNDNAPVLSANTLSPLVPGINASTRYTFTITYTDIDNNTFAQVNLTVGTWTGIMSKQNPADNNYVDGCIFTITIILNQTGVYQHSFTASDGVHVVAAGPYAGPEIGLAPDVEETFEEIPIGTKVTAADDWEALPGDGEEGSLLTYFVEYTGISAHLHLRDYHNINSLNILYNCTDSPAIPGQYMVSFDFIYDGPSGGPQWVYIDLRDAGGIKCSIMYYNLGYLYGDLPDMYVYQHPTPITSGVKYHVQIETLSNDTYRLIINGVATPVLDNVLPFTGPITGISFRTIVGVTTASAWIDDIDLSWLPNTNEPALTSGSINSTTGNQATQFNFTVVYTDADNNAPAHVDVVLNGTAHAMVKHDINDLDYTDGVLYELVTFLAAGSYSYYFNCSDGVHANSTGTFTGLVVSYTNTQAPQIISPQVTPPIEVNQTYTFSFTYLDVDNNMPASVNLTINGTVVPLARLDPLDTNAMDGLAFSYSTVLDFGYYQYRFDVSDGLLDATTGWIPAPTVHPFYFTSNESLFADDFESGTSKWSFMNGDWHVTTRDYQSPTHSMWAGSEATGQYSANRLNQLITASFSLARTPTAYLRLRHRTGIYLGDAGYIQISIDGGGWINIASYGQFTTFSWRTDVFNLSSYCGSQDVRLRFYFTTDGSWSSSGWYLDDVNVYTNRSALNVALLEPTNGTTTSGGLAVDFAWTNLVWPVVIPNYTWQIASDALFSTVVDEVHDIPQGTTNTTFARVLSLPTGRYYWRVIPTYSIFQADWSIPFVLDIYQNLFSPVLSGDSVTPATGSELTGFTFSVVYSDADNNAPVDINVTIDGTTHAMQKENMDDNNYIDGCVYVYMTTLGTGAHAYNFSCSDGVFTNATATAAGPMVSKAPECSSPPDSSVLANATGVAIPWQLFTSSDIGMYRVLANGVPVLAWAAWPGNGTSVNFQVDTGAGLGRWIFTIEYNDSNGLAGVPDAVAVTVNDIPNVTGGEALNNTCIPGNATGYAISWTFHDAYGGTGSYQVLRNGTSIATAAWTGGFTLDFPVSTSIGYATFNYTLRYVDGNGTAGTESSVLVTVVLVPASSHPADFMVLANATSVNVTWVLYTSFSAGQYRVSRDGTQLVPWTAWLGNGSTIDVAVNTGLGLGPWEYTIEYNDSTGFFGIPDSVIVTVNDIPNVTGGEALNNTCIPGNATGYAISWTFHDAYGGTGSYQVLRNGTGIASSSWADGQVLDVPVSTSIGYATFNYTLRYVDGNGTAGTESTVLVTIVLVPASSHPADFMVLANATNVNVTWVLYTSFSPGHYRVSRNSTQLVPWTAWLGNGSSIDVAVNTGLTLGKWQYTIEYNDSTGFFGIPDSVLVTLNDMPRANLLSPVNNTVLLANSIAGFAWDIDDAFGGTGTYTISVNGVAHPQQVWTSGSWFGVIFNTTTCGTFNYSIVYQDFYGLPGVPSCVIVTVAEAPSCTHPADMILLQGSAGATISWVLVDPAGAGQHRVLVDAAVVTGWTPWTNGSAIEVPVATTGPVDEHVYTLEFNNTYGLVSIDVVLVTIDDTPACIASPADIDVVAGGAGAVLSWTLVDGIGAGSYTLYVDGNAVVTYTGLQWTNNTAFTLPVDSSLAAGAHNYTLVFWDSNGFRGNQSTVTVTIVAAGNPFMAFLEENWPYLGIALAGIVIIGAAIGASRKKKAVKASTGTKKKGKGYELPYVAGFGAPGTGTTRGTAATLAPKASPGYTATTGLGTGTGTGTGTRSHVQASGPAVQPAPATAKFYCNQCARYYDIQNPDVEAWYSCPSCSWSLTLVVNCTSCGNPVALDKETHDKLKRSGALCSYCGNTVVY